MTSTLRDTTHPFGSRRSPNDDRLPPASEILTNWQRIGSPTLNDRQGELTRRAQTAAAQGDASKIAAIKFQRESLIGFTKYRFRRYRAAKHHRFIAEQVERVERKEIDRLMLLMPRGTARTGVDFVSIMERRPPSLAAVHFGERVRRSGARLGQQVRQHRHE